MNRYFPGPKSKPLPTLKSAVADGRTVSGSYVVSRRGDSGFSRYLTLLQPIDVTADANGTLTLPLLSNAAGIPKRWREIKPFVWQEVNGTSLIQARVRDGKVEQIGMDDIGPIVVLLPAGPTAAMWNLILLASSIAIFALAVLFWPIKAVLRWRYDRPMSYDRRGRWLYRLTRVVALIDLVVLAGFPLAFLLMTGYLAQLSPSIDWLFRGLQLLCVVGVLGAVIPVAEFAHAIRDPARPWWTKASDLLLATAALAMVWFAFAEHLLTVGLRY
jgi:hypothetical protein